MWNSEMVKKVRHPYFGVGLKQWIENLLQYGVDKRHIHKYLAISSFSLKLAPQAMWEKYVYREILNDWKFEKDPIFVIGHWRSGTTHLQNILTRDPQWGYLNSIQSVFPNVFLRLEEKFSLLLPDQKRAMDNVKVNAKTPSEDEIALATICRASFWQGYYFTNEMDYYFNKYVLFDGISQKELSDWKDGYLYLLKKLSFKNNGKQLLLKNPPNTARVRFLLEMFPKAKFIHICRNPIDVFQSRIKQYDSAVRMKDLQNLSKDAWQDKTLRYYQLMMDKYLKERSYIPEGNLVEVSFESLRDNPIETVKRIYRTLDLPGYENALPNFQNYVNKLKEYKQNDYAYDPAVVEMVKRNWERYAETFNYEIKALNRIAAAG